MKKYIREPFSALSHLFGAVLSVEALLLLLEKSGDSDRAIIASTIFGVSLILLYVASALTHGVNCSQEMVDCIERFDHAAIFLLIAGTYTPLCLLVIKGPLGWTLLSCEWIMAGVGISSLILDRRVPRHLRVGIYIAMGWLFLFAIGPIVSALPNSFLAWLVGGGVIYSVGAIIFLTNKPNLWRGYFEAHDLWHLFVIGGSACHFIFIKRFLEAFNS